MNKGLFSALKDKYSGLNSREKLLVWIAAAVAAVLLADRLILSPLRSYNDELAFKTAEKVKLLADLQKYSDSKSAQKSFFKGKATDFLTVFLQKAKESRFGPVRLKRTENSDKGIVIKFEGEGDIRGILDFITSLEKMDVLLFFRKADILFQNSGSKYRFEGEILVVKG